MDGGRVSPYGPNACELYEADDLVMNNLCKGPVCCTSAGYRGLMQRSSFWSFLQTDR